MDRKKFLKHIALSTPAAIVALSSGKLFSNPIQQTQGEIIVGFAKCSLVPAIQSSTAFRRDLEAVCAVIKDDTMRVALVALDLIEITPQTNIFLQKQISELTGFPQECILLHTTHTHASPWDSREENSMNGLSDEIAQAVLKAEKLAVPAKLKTANADVGDSLSFQRIGYAGEELGYQSFWYGYQYREGDNRPDAGALVNEMKSRWLGKEPEYKAGNTPVWYDRKVDPLVQTLVFEDVQGNTIGSIVRFSAHAGPADACKDRKFDPDFPAVVRDRVEKELGGTGMYMSGPLGNLAPKVKMHYVLDKNRKLPENYLGPTWAIVANDEKQALAERDRIGKEIADAALASIKEKKAQVLNSFQFQTQMHELPLDPTLPTSVEDIELVKNMLIPEYNAFKNRAENIRELRRLANRFNWLEWTRQFVDLITPEDRANGYTKLPLSILKMNKTCMAFTHSETMAETSLELRKAFPDLNLIAVCLTGGTTQYIPTAEIKDIGGYEGRATVTTRDGEEKIRHDITAMIKGVL